MTAQVYIVFVLLVLRFGAISSEEASSSSSILWDFSSMDSTYSWPWATSSEHTSSSSTSSSTNSSTSTPSLEATSTSTSTTTTSTTATSNSSTIIISSSSVEWEIDEYLIDSSSSMNGFDIFDPTAWVLPTLSSSGVLITPSPASTSTLPSSSSAVPDIDTLFEILYEALAHDHLKKRRRRDIKGRRLVKGKAFPMMKRSSRTSKPKTSNLTKRFLHVMTRKASKKINANNI